MDADKLGFRFLKGKTKKQQQQKQSISARNIKNCLKGASVYLRQISLSLSFSITGSVPNKYCHPVENRMCIPMGWQNLDMSLFPRSRPVSF